jgi:hypothetical protein
VAAERGILGSVKRVVRRPYRAVTRWLARNVFERGVHDTSEYQRLDEFGLDAPDRLPYDASRWFYLFRALRGMKIDRDDVFVDFGSGKGRVVYQAARRYPFRRVVGIEIAEELTQMARENIEHNRHRLKCQNVELVTSDATKFEIPDDMTYAYFLNPFQGEVFRTVLANIVASIDRNPRKVTILYVNPEDEDAIRDTGRFTIVSQRRGLRRDQVNRRIHVWVSTPARVAAG